MKIILRDDDTCYFTKPEELERAFGKVWDFAPVSLALIPFIWSGLKPILSFENHPQEKSEKFFPVGENKELVEFLRKLLKEKKICLMLHGYSHKYYNHQYYIEGAEFVAGENLYQKVKEGKQYLEKLFETKITTFVPPSNVLSEEGWKAVTENGLNISGIPNFLHFSRLKHPDYWIPFLKKIWFKSQTGYTYPYPMNLGKHQEIPYLSLSEKSPFWKIKKALMAVYKKNGVFCLATHYWTLIRSQGSKKLFDEFIKETKKLPKTEFLTINDFLLKKSETSTG